MAEPRPHVDDAMELEAARIVAAKIVPTDVDFIAEVIARKYRYPMAGFDLVKRLDKWQSWDTTREEMKTPDD